MKDVNRAKIFNKVIVTNLAEYQRLKIRSLLHAQLFLHKYTSCMRNTCVMVHKQFSLCNYLGYLYTTYMRLKKTFKVAYKIQVENMMKSKMPKIFTNHMSYHEAQWESKLTGKHSSHTNYKKDMRL